MRIIFIKVQSVYSELNLFFPNKTNILNLIKYANGFHSYI